MGRKSRRNRSIAGAVIALCLLACLAIVGMYHIRLKREMESVRFEYEDINRNVDFLNGQIAEINAEAEGIKAETLLLSNIEERIPEKKQEFHDLCRQLEEAVIADETDAKIAYLTFDDGPYTDTTPKYLDVLEEKNVLATFFQLGKPSEQYDPIYRRVYETGHTIANHTYSHRIKDGIYRSVDAFINDVIRNREFIENKLGYTTNILRFPGGSETAAYMGVKNGIVERLRELGYGYVDWNIMTGDGTTWMTPQAYRDNILLHTDGRKILVVLMHDYSPNSLIALPEIIDGLREQGYTLLPLFYESSMVIK
ncbi:MAG: polysaccharide deacetylase [Solobacterium sp.]|nr:polysaccharide deacetylase [Solobacterium sp.]